MRKDEPRSSMKLSPTPYPEVNTVLNELLPEVQGILGNQFIGMYLYGSLAYGGFDQDSDVDFIVVTEDDLPDALFTALQKMHTRIAKLDSWCATQLEGSYIPRHSLQTFDSVHVLHLHIDRGKDEHLQRMLIEDDRLSRAWWGGWVFMRAILWEHGIALAGPDPQTFIEPVPPGELKQAAQATLEGWLEPFLKDIGELANPGYQPYCVLTLCRILYTLEYDAIASKQVAARWVQETLGEPWIALIDRAWFGRHDPHAKASKVDVDGILDFIRFTLDRIYQ